MALYQTSILIGRELVKVEKGINELLPKLREILANDLNIRKN